ncbi:MAG TPA: gluconeogenesis factor YvcK family protein [Dongiaceae bacterium]|nr:gluconeogenesis factor YvcK family protein [Dongiaceae bacterium]
MKDPFAQNEVKIAVIGGGTGSFTMLSALKKYTSQIAAIVSMADDGGSTGVLRDELGTLPPGDVRQCLVALSDSPKVRDLFEYRFDAGTFSGHSFGNVLLTALEKITGDFTQAVETASEILRIRGVVIPATLDDVRLKMEWADKSLVLHGERVIDAEYFRHDPRKARLSLTPAAASNPMAIAAIEQADIVVVAPGDLYTSLGPLLVINGIGEALEKTKAKVFYVANLVSKQGQTDNFTVSDHAAEIERFAGRHFLDYVLYNQQAPSEEIARRYEEEGGYVTIADVDKLMDMPYEAVGGNFLGAMASLNSADTLIGHRSLIRHDATAVAKLILDLYRRDDD